MKCLFAGARSLPKFVLSMVEMLECLGIRGVRHASVTRKPQKVQSELSPVIRRWRTLRGSCPPLLPFADLG